RYEGPTPYPPGPPSPRHPGDHGGSRQRGSGLRLLGSRWGNGMMRPGLACLGSLLLLVRQCFPVLTTPPVQCLISFQCAQKVVSDSLPEAARYRRHLAGEAHGLPSASPLGSKPLDGSGEVTLHLGYLLAVVAPVYPLVIMLAAVLAFLVAVC